MCSRSSRSRFRSRLGVSSAIAAAIIIPLMLLVVFWAMHVVWQSSQAAVYRASFASRVSTAIVKGTLYVANTTVSLVAKNTGASEAVLTSVMLTATTSSGSTTKMVIAFYSGSPNTTSVTVYVVPGSSYVKGLGVVIPPGKSVSIAIDLGTNIQNASAVGVLSDGRTVVFTPVKKLSASGVPATLVTFFVPSLTDLLTRSDIEVNPQLLAPASPSDPGEGMEGGQELDGVYCLVANYTNVKISGIVYYTAAYIGFAADWTQTRAGTPKYTMLIVTTDLWRGDLQIGADTYTFNDYPAYRIVIYDYEGSITVHYVWQSPVWGWEVDTYSNAGNPAKVVGIYLYAQLYGYYSGVQDAKSSGYASYIELNGVAQKVYVYARKIFCGSSLQVSYTPYMVIADFDNDGYPEILFTTIDALFDVNTNWVGDDIDTTQYSLIWNDLDDYSTVPFTIVFKGYPIDSKKYVAVQVAIRYYFEDDAALDENEIDTDKWIVRIGLMDASTGQLATYYELRYQYLTKHEDTYPPRWDYVIDTILLPVPQTGHTYYLVLQFRDPYPDYSSYDDCDVMVGIEYLSISFIYQP